ncbi:cytochrome C assembly family protein [Marinospirillum alkaliphilum]|nr:cytochrome c biogenesis protein CcsA [Marinospirillum alkaliphilum]
MECINPSMAAFLPFTLLAAAFYLAGASWVWLRLARKVPERAMLVRMLGLGALLTHGFALYGHLGLPLDLNLGFLEAASLVSWLICAFILLSSLRHPTLNLAAALFPMAALLGILTHISSGDVRMPRSEDGLFFHILASLSAYSLFALASVQALLLAMQNHQLKHRHVRGLISVLPPLQTMERLLFDLLLAGQLLLTVGILSGFLFFDDMFARGLMHKTLLSMAAWLTFGLLLIGHWRLGWRGMTAVRWTLGGSLLLLLAYFGSKFVLQFILG